MKTIISLPSSKLAQRVEKSVPITFTTLRDNSADDKLTICFLIFLPEKKKL